jgi:MoaA/NifB/PqqE/SkfB family radical SAM enzyme
MEKYQVISLHFDNDCNLKCPMCYRHRFVAKDEKMDYDFWIKSIPHIKQITDQVALGGGEPFLHPEFIMKFAKEAKKHDLIVNVTTNGTIPLKPEWIKDLTMISFSYDQHKWPGSKGFKDYIIRIRGVKESELVKVGCNLLMEDWLLSDYQKLVHLILHIFRVGKADMVFALLPKKTKTPDIIKHRGIYNVLTYLFDEFYVDDCTRMIFENNGYDEWKKPCHYGSDMFSIDECGQVTGCSFSDKILLRLKKPKDILKIPKIKFEKRMKCPYLEVDTDIRKNK